MLSNKGAASLISHPGSHWVSAYLETPLGPQRSQEARPLKTYGPGGDLWRALGAGSLKPALSCTWQAPQPQGHPAPQSSCPPRDAKKMRVGRCTSPRDAPWTGVASNNAAPLVPKVLLGPVGHLGIQLSRVKNVRFKSSYPELGAFVPLGGHWQCVRLFWCHESGWGLLASSG